MVKYNFDGSLDTHFGVGGEIIATPRGVKSGSQIVSTPDGGFLVYGHDQSLLLKFTDAGNVDTTFGSNGSVPLTDLTDIGSIKVDSRGRILIPAEGNPAQGNSMDAFKGVVRRLAPVRSARCHIRHGRRFQLHTVCAAKPGILSDTLQLGRL